MYGFTCSQCHGPEGAGEGETLGDSETRPPDFRTVGWQDFRTDKEILAIVRKGGEVNGLSNAMPPWEDALTDAEIARIADVLRGFGDR